MGTTILFKLIKETTLAFISKVAWKAVFERFYTRLVVFGLNKLKAMSTNDVVDDTVQDIIDSLKGKKLAVIDKEIK